jgi:hypothetical protein
MTWGRLRQKAILKLFSNYNWAFSREQGEKEFARLFILAIILRRLLDQCGYRVGMDTYGATETRRWKPSVADHRHTVRQLTSKSERPRL